MSLQAFLKCKHLHSSALKVKQIRLPSLVTPPRPISYQQSRLYSLYEPDYLDSLKPKVPLYDVLNIQLKGYNFTVLESYQKLVNNIAQSIDLEVEDGWATPPQHFQIQKYKPQSTVIDAEYKLTVYERNLQLIDLPSTVAPILFELLKTALPEGVHLRIHNHEPDHEEIRYVPDRELIELKTQLDTLGGPTKKK